MRFLITFSNGEVKEAQIGERFFESKNKALGGALMKMLLEDIKEMTLENGTKIEVQ